VNEQTLPQNIGPYQIIKSLGKGGMGEVFLAYDPKCQREVALKRIRPDLSTQEVIKNRFLKEAIITSKLAHPAIVPIYSLHEEEGQLYYIMPYLEGKTLKELIKKAQKNETENSVASFLRIFLSLCQACAYAHSKGYLHRDLKPENIIVGNFGQVYILDWGLVKAIDDLSQDESLLQEKDEEEEETLNSNADHKNLTRPGKLVGTLAYMAPERVRGESSSVFTDIYALGVIFYQLLTLQLPFRRKSLKEFRAQLKKERLPDPVEVAPYRDIPPELVRLVKKCLNFDKSKRYKDVVSLIEDLENYIVGRSDWFLHSQLDIFKKSDWEFQENIVIPKSSHKSEWVNASVSKKSFSGNTQLLASIKISAEGSGIGFLLSIPEASQRNHPLEGYSLWLSAKDEEPTKLFKSSVEVMRLEEIKLSKEEWHEIRFEKIDRHIHCYINEKLIFSYISYLPLLGTHVGVVFKDADFEIKPLKVSMGSLNLKLSCLAIPDAFLANKDYFRALAEYRRIAYAFAGRQESREALFLSGITLLEKAKSVKDSMESENILNEAINEFEKLRGSPGAPLEYLGKALVYEALGEVEEEIKCFALAIRRYQGHPLLPLLNEQILFRLHSRTKKNRLATFQFALLVLTNLTNTITQDTLNLFDNLEKQLEPLFFIQNDSLELQPLYFALHLSYLFNKPFNIKELGKKSTDHKFIQTCLIALLQLREHDLVKELLPEVASEEFGLISAVNQDAGLDELELLINKAIDDQQAAILLCSIIKALDNKHIDKVIEFHNRFYDKLLTIEAQFQFDLYLIWALLIKNDWINLEALFNKYPLDYLNQETTLLHFLYGCFLYSTEGKEIANIHFSGILDTAYPKSSCLASHYLFSKGIEPTSWFSNAFPIEKLELYRQLCLFYRCNNNATLEIHYQREIDAFYSNC
jgi:serine/threonine protein kinase